MATLNDWRLTGQEDYLMGATLFYKNYVDRKTKTDHDHCEFCFTKFSDNYPDTLQAGYATADDYRWICPSCFEDFKDMFQFVGVHGVFEETPWFEAIHYLRGIR